MGSCMRESVFQLLLAVNSSAFFNRPTEAYYSDRVSDLSGDTTLNADSAHSSLQIDISLLS